MIEQQGRVVGVSGDRVRVAVGAQTGCSACDAGQGCGAGLFGRLLRRRPVELDLDGAGRVQVGDAVRVGIGETVFLRLVMQLYGLPLLLGLAAGGLSHHVSTTYGAAGGLRDALTLAGMLAGAAVALRMRPGRAKASALAGEVRLLSPDAIGACRAPTGSGH